MAGILYGVGVGTGNPELITLKALNILKEVDIIAVPKTKNEADSTALNIVKEYISNKQILELIFPMTLDTNKLNEHWEKSTNIITNLLDQNKNIAFITLGDPTIYSTYMYLNNKITNLGYKTVIIPGITSFCSAAAVLNTSLAENNENIAIVSDIDNLELTLQQFDTIILMKFKNNFNIIKNLLIKKNLYSKTIIVEKCTMENQKIHTNIKDINSDDLSYFSIMIIKKVI